MPDIVDTATRSRMMSGIRGKDTKPEMRVRRRLHAAGLRYRLHAKDLPGKPDIVFRGLRTVLFVHGCFWHRHPGCRYAYTPKSHEEFWSAKLMANVARDSTTESTLTDLGWRVLVVWECETSPARLAPLIDGLRSSHLRSAPGAPADRV